MKKTNSEMNLLLVIVSLCPFLFLLLTVLDSDNFGKKNKKFSKPIYIGTLYSVVIVVIFSFIVNAELIQPNIF